MWILGLKGLTENNYKGFLSPGTSEIVHNIYRGVRIN